MSRRDYSDRQIADVPATKNDAHAADDANRPMNDAIQDEQRDGATGREAEVGVEQFQGGV